MMNEQISRGTEGSMRELSGVMDDCRLLVGGGGGDAVRRGPGRRTNGRSYGEGLPVVGRVGDGGEQAWGLGWKVRGADRSL